MSDVYVELSNEFRVTGRMRTGGSGRFFFSGLPHGRYVIKVLTLGTGFMEQTAEVEIAGIGVGGQMLSENVQKDIYLGLRKGADAIPFKNAVIYAQEIPPEAEALFKEAVSDLDSNRVPAGIERLERAVEIFPTYFAALQRLGVVRLAQERFDDAASIFQRALAVNDRSFDCWYGLSYAHFSARKFRDAVSAAEKAALLRPDSMEANLVLGMSQRMVKDYEKAEKALKQAAQIAQGSSPEVHWQLALLYGKEMNRFADAAKELESYLRAYPEAPNKEEIRKLIASFKDKAKIRG